MSSAIDQRVADVLARIHSFTVHEAAAFRDAGALLVDIRPREQRESFGLIPGALVIERNVLEWRLDPTSTHRHRIAAAHRGAIVPEVYDLRGGFDAWAAARLPTDAPSGPRSTEVAR